MKMMKITRSAAAVSALGLSLFLGGCEFLDGLGGSCQTFAADHEKAVLSEGALVTQIDTSGDFSMAMVLNATAINKLFRAAAEKTWNYSIGVSGFSVPIPFPVIQVGGCRSTGFIYQYPEAELANCLTFDFPVGVNVLGSYYGVAVKFGVPFVAVLDGTVRTRMYIDLGQAQLLKLDGTAGGSSGSVPGFILQGIELGVKELFSKELKRRVHLFDIAAWEIGDRQIKMLAGSPRVNEQEGTLMFGMYSNLLFAQSTSVRWEEAFPSDAEIGFHIHPDLIRGLIARMMYEGHVARTLSTNEAGSDDMLSGVKITMANMAQEYPQDILLALDPDFQKYFTMAFRFWNTTAFCGYMDILAGLHISLSNQAFNIGIGNITTGHSAGAMRLVSGLVSIVTQSQFFADVVSYANYSINFDEITVPDGNGTRKAKMDAKKFQFSLDGNGISLYLNFLDL
ncbi:MAG: hypothetical protein FWC40_10210 [Proteobacteria bacterium]|nr:hypothetical protein [Pseudomonadota bacterium]